MVLRTPAVSSRMSLQSLLTVLPNTFQSYAFPKHTLSCTYRARIPIIRI